MTFDSMSGVAVAWTGGKDSALAFYESEMLGYKVNCLVTFAWSQETFLAHPLDFITLQAEALQLPQVITIPQVYSYDKTRKRSVAQYKVVTHVFSTGVISKETDGGLRDGDRNLFLY